MVDTTTRERLVTEAMKLFSQQGFKATSVAQIEAAAGLAPGSGALYHHFKSKEALLEAGIDRQLDRRGAMRDIRALFAGLNDLDTELTLLGRYLLAVLDEETQLLQVAARTPAGHAARLQDAYAALIEGLYAELGDWLRNWLPKPADDMATNIAMLGVDALVGHRATRVLFHTTEIQLPDARYLTEWTSLIAARIQQADQNRDATA
ncbi:TetR/AcrR family transcriptional regulator [Mycolicibacterium hippocampi]|uniref:Transcriptional regulator, AcrR family n=1 Tax=Mycolicibacterium hippocampi TaxID=659824 RepID=A0A850PGW0_9MYCO|nr:TetR/AcrR family transcriptional regulator [Mycolicibacterium hippocampi]NVN49352.1 Transcriptional regulator, AcrR family [Mycolicibacterium hippocampi]